MLRTWTIIIVTKIMVEVLKMNWLLWCLRVAAKMAIMMLLSTCASLYLQRV